MRSLVRLPFAVALAVAALASVCMPALFASAQELHNEDRGVYRAEVVEVISEERGRIPGTDIEQTYQTIRAELLEGPQRGDIVTIENDYLQLKAGDRFYANHAVLLDGSDRYGVIGVDRLNSLYMLAGFFVLAVILFGGWQGVRSLIALGGSFAAIFYVLIPGLLAGYSPLMISFTVAAIILAAAIFFTHGVNRESAVAFSGTMLAVFCTGIFAVIAVSLTQLTGFAAEESVYLNINTGGALDFTGLLLGAIIIGVLGVLDDIAITQAAIVGELYNSKLDMSKFEAYRRAIRVGREHVGALVNTLVLAYTGAALPLLLLFRVSDAPAMSVLNMEIVATELVRTIIGSIGLILAVPLVTALAVWFLHGHTHDRSGAAHTHGHAHGGV